MLCRRTRGCWCRGTAGSGRSGEPCAADAAMQANYKPHRTSVAKLPLRQRLRAEVAAHPPLWRFYRGVRSRLLYEYPEPGPIHRVLRELAGEGGEVRFVQVGSNDAVFGDPIMEFVLACGWRGVLVE